MAQVSSELLRLIDQILDNDASITVATKSYYKRAYIAKAQTAAGQMEIRQIAARVLQPGVTPGMQGFPSGEGGGESGEEPAAQVPKPAGWGGIYQPSWTPTQVKLATAQEQQAKLEASPTHQWESKPGVQLSRGAAPQPAQPQAVQTEGQKTGVIAKLIRAGDYEAAQELLDTWVETDPTVDLSTVGFLQDSLDAARKRGTGTGGSVGAQWRPGELELQQEEMKFRREQERNTILMRMQQLQQDIAQMRLTAAQSSIPPGMTSVPGTEPGGFLANNPYHRGGAVPLVSTPWEPPPPPTLQQLGGY